MVTTNISDYMEKTEAEVLLGRMAEVSVVKMLVRRIYGSTVNHYEMAEKCLRQLLARMIEP